MKTRVIEAFEARFGRASRLVVRAPGRVNLIGEHTDYNEGHVLPMALERAAWLAFGPRVDDRVVVESLDRSEPIDFSLSGFEHTGHPWAEYVKGMARVLLDAGKTLRGWEGVLASSIPIGAGLSSSAALEMAVGQAFASVSGFAFVGREMARWGQRAENEWVGARTGIMDQMICANAEAGSALWIDCRSLAAEPVPLPVDTRILVMDTMTRHAHTGSGYNERRTSCERAARALGVAALRDLDRRTLEARSGELDATTHRRVRHVVTENERVVAAVAAMRAGDGAGLGRLMDESHASLRDDFEVTNAELDCMVGIARARPGCLGARMTGGGFGGCAIALVEAGAAADLGPEIARRYEGETGRRPDVFATQAGAGTRIV